MRAHSGYADSANAGPWRLGPAHRDLGPGNGYFPAARVKMAAINCATV
jgi:hypothetical protein